jgi:hypothetical protein
MQRPRTPANLSESLHQRLDSYALAASAAGVSVLALIPPAQYVLSAGATLAGLLALSKPAEAKVVYTSANVAIGYGGLQHYRLDLNHDGIKDFVFTAYSTDHGSAGNITVRPRQPRNLIWGTVGFASALSSGVKVRSNKMLQKSNSLMYGWGCFTGPTSCSTIGFWQNVQNRYLGLKFYIKGKAHYGWARLNESMGTVTLTGYAYETIPNKPIITGKTNGRDKISGDVQSSRASSVPATLEPTTLARLAQGAHGLRSWYGRTVR